MATVDTRVGGWPDLPFEPDVVRCVRAPRHMGSGAFTNNDGEARGLVMADEMVPRARHRWVVTDSKVVRDRKRAMGERATSCRRRIQQDGGIGKYVSARLAAAARATRAEGARLGRSR